MERAEPTPTQAADRAQPRGFDALYGLRVIELGDGLARGEVAVREQLMQPAGQLHGGVYASVAEGLASLATDLALAGEHKHAVGHANHTSVLHAIAAGTVHATARAQHRGRSTWVWEVEMSDDGGRLCALARVTLAVRDRREL